MLAALVRVPDLLLGPVWCRLAGHHWHTFLRVTTMRVCDRCGFVVDDPRFT
jgi:hypothetical protein